MFKQLLSLLRTLKCFYDSCWPCLVKQLLSLLRAESPQQTQQL